MSETNVVESQEIAKIANSITQITEKLESTYLSKAEFKHESGKFAEAVQGLSKEMNSVRKEAKADPLFGNQKDAEAFVDCLKSAMANSELPEVRKMTENAKSEWFINKDLNGYGTGTGIETVPTATSPIFSYLLAQYGVARRDSTVFPGVRGNLVLTKRNGTSTAAFTAAAGVVKEDVAVTPSVFGTDKITLSPAQISILSLVSDKLLYESAVNIAEMVAIDMAEQAGILEDNTVLKGDGTSTYGGCTGLVNASINSTSDSAANGVLNFDKLLLMTSNVAESVYQSPNAKFYMNPIIINTYKTKKASTSGLYFADPATGDLYIGAHKVQPWWRMDSTVATGKNIAIFGDLKKAVNIATGREYKLEVSRDYKFNTNQLAYRLTYDFSAGVIQPTAACVLTLTS